uniref:Reverse transcriptase Ty1/copia-type domain-containing protein n=1 Tax=Glossina morsitans morsitans TaxID=37546 RepID=A0A1B0G0A5_GLOMM
MVHSNRKSTKSLAVKDVSPLRNTTTAPANKYELSSSPQIGYKLEVPVRAIVGEATTNKWFWNDMMKKIVNTSIACTFVKFSKKMKMLRMDLIGRFLDGKM